MDRFIYTDRDIEGIIVIPKNNFEPSKPLQLDTVSDKALKG
jgi:hypothetical protein